VFRVAIRWRARIALARGRHAFSLATLKALNGAGRALSLPKQAPRRAEGEAEESVRMEARGRLRRSDGATARRRVLSQFEAIQQRQSTGDLEPI